MDLRPATIAKSARRQPRWWKRLLTAGNARVVLIRHLVGLADLCEYRRVRRSRFLGKLLSYSKSCHALIVSLLRRRRIIGVSASELSGMNDAQPENRNAHKVTVVIFFMGLLL